MVLLHLGCEVEQRLDHLGKHTRLPIGEAKQNPVGRDYNGAALCGAARSGAGLVLLPFGSAGGFCTRSEEQDNDGDAE